MIALIKGMRARIYAHVRGGMAGHCPSWGFLAVIHESPMPDLLDVQTWYTMILSPESGRCKYMRLENDSERTLRKKDIGFPSACMVWIFAVRVQ